MLERRLVFSPHTSTSRVCGPGPSLPFIWQSPRTFGPAGRLQFYDSFCGLPVLSPYGRGSAPYGRGFAPHGPERGARNSTRSAKDSAVPGFAYALVSCPAWGKGAMR